MLGNSLSPPSGNKTAEYKGGGTGDYWVVKIDANGTKIWDKSYGGSTGESNAIALTNPNGGYLIGGRSNSPISGDKTDPGAGGSDFWIVKIDDSGNKLWDKCFGGASVDVLNAAVQSFDDGYLLGGYSSSDASGNKTHNSFGGNDYWIVKIDSNGSKIWDKNYGSSDTDTLTTISNSNNGGFCLVVFQTLQFPNLNRKTQKEKMTFGC